MSQRWRPDRAETDDQVNDRGQILVLMAAMTFGLLVMAGFSVDVGQWFSTANRAQRAADNAAIAAVKELVSSEQATGDRGEAEVRAHAAAEAVAAQNGFDVNDGGITVTTTFRTVGTSDVAEVTINDGDVPMFFAGLVMSDMEIGRDAEAIMGGCEGECGGEVVIPPPVGVFIDVDAGGDGYQAERVGDYFFNIFHHTSSAALTCVDVRTNDLCDGANYPVAPYPDVKTNYTPKVEAIGDKVYFIAQKPNSTILGCWDSITHAKCTGFNSGVQLAAYQRNGSNNETSRINGPDLVNGRLFMYGDDNRMYCYDPLLAAICSGYPKNTSLKGVHDLEVDDDKAGIAGGVKTDGVQFDTVVHPDGRIWHAIGPTENDEVTWVGCWNTTTNASCTGWTNRATSAFGSSIFFQYNTSGVVSGVCVSGGKQLGDINDECFPLGGGAMTSPLPWTMKSFGEQPATAVTSAGHRVTYFPDNSGSRAMCWDWTTGTACSHPPTNWGSTKEYAYTWDGGIGGCIVGLGHEGRMWSFRVDDGQAPCEGNSTGQGTITACTCVGTGLSEWTALALSENTDLADYSSFQVTITRPDGTVFTSVDLVELGSGVIDLSPLNLENPVPTSLTITATAITLDGEADTAWFGTDAPTLIQIGGTKPTLLS